MNLFTLLNGNNYVSFNRAVAHLIGLHETLILSELLDKYEYFKSHNLLDDGWFYLTMECVQQRTTLGRHPQSSAIKKLKELGLVQVQQRGMPSKRNFKINEDKIKEMFAGCLKTATKDAKSDKQGCLKTATKDVSKRQPALIYKEPKEEDTKKNNNKSTSDEPSSDIIISSVEQSKKPYDRLRKKILDALIKNHVPADDLKLCLEWINDHLGKLIKMDKEKSNNVVGYVWTIYKRDGIKAWNIARYYKENTPSMEVLIQKNQKKAEEVYRKLLLMGRKDRFSVRLDDYSICFDYKSLNKRDSIGFKEEKFEEMLSCAVTKAHNCINIANVKGSVNEIKDRICDKMSKHTT